MLVIGRTICGVHENFSLPSNISGKIISIVKVLLEKIWFRISLNNDEYKIYRF